MAGAVYFVRVRRVDAERFVAGAGMACLPIPFHQIGVGGARAEPKRWHASPFFYFAPGMVGRGDVASAEDALNTCCSIWIATSATARRWRDSRGTGFPSSGGRGRVCSPLFSPGQVRGVSMDYV